MSLSANMGGILLKDYHALLELYETEMSALPVFEFMLVMEEVAITELDHDLIKWKLGMYKDHHICTYHRFSFETLYSRLNDFKVRCAAKARELEIV